jgi:hypothetical protein
MDASLMSTTPSGCRDNALRVTSWQSSAMVGGADLLMTAFMIGF